MALSRDRKLDLLGLALAGVVVLSVGLLVFGAVELPSSGATPPAANWTVERVNDTHVAIGHTGGEPVPAEELAVTVNGRNRPTPFAGTVREGDEATLRVSSGRTVGLYWIGGSGTRDLLAQQEDASATAQ